MNRLDDQLCSELAVRQDARLKRRLHIVPSNVLDLASNDYLGLAQHPEVVDGACRAVEEWGGGARASRLLGGHTSLHARLETALAAWKGCEAALVFSSGYAANIGVITALAHAGDFVFCDKRNHASLIDACRLAQSKGARGRYFGSLEKLESLLQRTLDGDSARCLIVSDTVFSMDGDLADLPALLALSQRFGAILVLDDAHGTGTLGADGSGAWKYFGLQEASCDVPIIQIGTLSKALGSQGGFVCGSQILCDWMVNAARPFIYSPGLNPAACGAALAALKVLQREPQRIQRLQHVTAQLTTGLHQLELDAKRQASPIIPLLLGDATRTLRWSEQLLARGVWCPAVRPPTVPNGASRLRITANSALSESDIERVLKDFAHVRDEERN